MSIEFLPATGVGRFNAKLNGNALQIKHRLSLVSDAIVPVTAGDLTNFQNAFQQLVTNHWEGKFMLQRAGVNVKPTFVLKFLARVDEAEAHFVVNLKQSQGGSENVGRDAKHGYAAMGAAAPRTASFMTGTIAQPDSAALTAVDLPKVLPYYVDFIGGNISPQTRSQVETLGRQIAKLNPQPRLQVTGYGANATNYQQTTMTLLTQCGLNNVAARSSNKIFIPSTWGKSSTSKMSGRTDYAKISVSNDLDTQSYLTQTAVNSYPATVVHEYGHMLGLQDEYNCLSTQAAAQMVQLHMIDASEQQKFENFHYGGAQVPSAKVATGQEEFVKACDRAGVAVPTFGRHTDSIMSAGSVFLPAHFVWIREAMVNLSGQNDWAIVPWV